MKRLIHLLPGLLVISLMTANLFAQGAGQFGNLPLWFEPANPAQFVAHGAKSEFVITPTGAEFVLVKTNAQTASGHLHLVGADKMARITGEDRLNGRVNYLVGNDPAHWRTDVPTFSRVRVDDVYPGINVVYYGNQQRLEYDFNLAVGADPAVIALRFEGAEQVSLNSAGELVIRFSNGEAVQHRPIAYQMIDGRRQEIATGYKVVAPRTAAFVLGDYDPSRPLVIDPVLTYSTYYGGNYGDVASAIAVNQQDGSVYVAGQTYSTQFSSGNPFSTPGSFQTNYLGGARPGDAFVARFDSSGTNLIYATYLGGSDYDAAFALAVDNAGNAFVAGATISTDFPFTNSIPNGNKISGKVDTLVGYYPTDAFVTELDPSGSHLVYSTYLGGSGYESAYGITLDSADNAFVTGFTYSTNFPVTTNALQPHLRCPYTFYVNCNAFIAEVAAGGLKLNYSTYLGGTNFDHGQAIAFNNGRVFVAGYTYSTNFPTTNALNGFQYLNGSLNPNYSDGFVAAFTSSVTNLTPLYITLLGGSNYDAATGIAAAGDGTAYVCGATTSTNFPYTTTNVPYLTIAYVHTNTTWYINATNGFLTQIKWDGLQPAIGYSAMFGGLGNDVASGVALDPAGNAYVVGSASSTDFPATTNNISGYLSATNSSQINQGYSDAVIIAFNTNASALLYSAYLGGYSQDYGFAIAVDPLGNAYIAGQTLSGNFPTVNARQTFLNGPSDMFLAKISQTAVPFVPSLAIAPLPGGPSDILLQWQMFPANYNLESASNLDSGSWTVLPDIPLYTNGWYQVTVPATNDLEFFRLHQD